MKKVFLSLIATLIVFFVTIFAVSAHQKPVDAPFKVALITGYADVNDNSFNQSTYEGCKEWCGENNIPFAYYKPAGNSNTEREKSLELAIDRGYNAIFLPGFEYGAIIAKFAPKYPNVNFFGIDVNRGDFPPDYVELDNSHCYSYQE